MTLFKPFIHESFLGTCALPARWPQVGRTQAKTRPEGGDSLRTRAPFTLSRPDTCGWSILTATEERVFVNSPKSDPGIVRRDSRRSCVEPGSERAVQIGARIRSCVTALHKKRGDSVLTDRALVEKMVVRPGLPDNLWPLAHACPEGRRRPTTSTPERVGCAALSLTSSVAGSTATRSATPLGAPAAFGGPALLSPSVNVVREWSTLRGPCSSSSDSRRWPRTAP